MKYFNVIVLHKGKRNTLLIQSQDKKEALRKAKLKAGGGVVVKIEETSPPLEETIKQLKNEFIEKLSKRSINRQDLIASIRQLAVMTNAGIPLHEALLEISKATSNARLSYILQELAENINAGISFSKALQRYKGELGALTITMIELGERTGDMAKALFALADILEQIDENIRKFKKALRYPLITIGAMAIAFVILISFVVPKFKAIFAKLHAELPLPTKILLWLEHAFNTYGPYLIAALLITIFTVRYLYKSNEEFKYAMDRFMLKIYLLKDIVYLSQLSRFMLVFTELIKAGIPVVDALNNSVNMMDNAYLKEKLSIVKQMVEKGSSIQEAFKETGLLESMILQMLAAGETSGQLDAMLEKITEYYTMRFNYIVDNLSTYIEPIMLAIIAGMVLLLALGIFLPMWDLASAVKGGR
ncbi:MAG: type II secretion system protein F [Nitratiruptor sp.]|nr:type II secretion system protein F [Nitratiruptor sp.]NPA83297.1 type II secretion system F family protein [Campylobacterota bacterium]